MLLVETTCAVEMPAGSFTFTFTSVPPASADATALVLTSLRSLASDFGTVTLVLTVRLAPATVST